MTSQEQASADARYHFDAEELQKLKSGAPWMKDPKYFEKVANFSVGGHEDYDALSFRRGEGHSERR